MIIALSITTILNFVSLYKFSKIKNKNVLAKTLMACIICICIANLSTLLERIYSVFIPNSYPIYFEFFTESAFYVLCVMYLLVSTLFTNLKRSNSSISLLFLIPIISGILILTNDLHGLFFKDYVFDINNCTFGPAFYISVAYTFICIFLSYVLYLTILTKEHNEFTHTANYIYVYTMVPITIFSLNLIYHLNIPKEIVSIFCTPITFIIVKSLYVEKGMNISSIAVSDIISKMHGEYIVLDFNHNIIETNRAFENKFNYKSKSDNNSFIEKIDSLEKEKLITTTFANDIKEKLEEIKTTKKTYSSEFVAKIKEEDYYLSLNIVPIMSELRRKYIGSLITINDITKQKLELLTISEDQETIINQQHMATIGELTSGFAHDINTPLSAINTAISILEYNPKLTDECKDTIVKMKNAVSEIQSFSSNVRNELRNMDGKSSTIFSVNMAITNIINLSKTEMDKTNCTVTLKANKEYYLQGNSSKFSQVISNLLINAIQAYEEKGGVITIEIKKTSNVLSIFIKDKASGIPNNLKSSIFKKIIATDKENGNGLGLYISYSIIKSDFSGDITFDTKKDKGTTFKISIPCSTKEAK